MLQAELKILGGKHQGKLIPLNTKKFLVGREQDCHLRPNSELVSRHHCVFSIDEYAIRLRDLGSTNGTIVNGSNLRGEVILKSGDRITIGKLDLEMVIRQAAAKPAATAVQPPMDALPLTESDANYSTIEISPQTNEVETSYELAAYSDPLQGPPQAPPDTAILSGSTPPQYPLQPMQGYPASYPQGYPQQMPPSGYPMPGGFAPPQYPQYPQYPPGYGQMPGYAPPMGYPMAYPQMMPMQQGYPGMAAPAPVEAQVEEEVQTTEVLAVKLPNPEETGAKLPTPPQGGTAGGAKKEEKPSNTAADIIKQYMNRRT